MEEAQKRALIKRRAVVKARVTRIATFVNNFSMGSNLNDIRVRQKYLQNSIEEYNEIQTQLEVNDANESHDLDREGFEELYFELQSKIETLLEVKPLSSVRESSDISHNNNSDLKLPAISLPKFNGQLSEFMHFHDTFKSLVIDNDVLTDIQRYHYLLSCLSDEPHKLIENLPVTQNNFKLAWELICNRYNNPRLILDMHVRQLLSLPSAKTDHPKELRALINQTCSNLSAIEVMKIQTPLHEIIMSHYILERISVSLRKQWEVKTSGQSYPRLKELISFLESSCQTLELVSTNKLMNERQTQGTRYSSSKKESVGQAFVNTSSKCDLCDAPHLLFQCLKFRDMEINDKLDYVKRHKLCYNCLKSGHQTSHCSSRNCKLCNKRHHTLLHKDTDSISQQQSYCSLKGNYHTCEVLLSTAIIRVTDSKGRTHDCRTLLDSASQMNFMSRKLADRLGLALSKLHVPIQGISNSRAIESSHICQLHISSRMHDYSRHIVCSVLPTITGQLPSSHIDCRDWHLPSDISFADPQFNEPGEIDLLLGASVFLEVLRPGQFTQEGHPTIQNTVFGWVLAGCIPTTNISQKKSAAISCVATYDPLHTKVERFWQQEEFKGPPLSQEEKLCEEHFMKHTTRDETGRYTVKLPFRTQPEQLGDSFNNAMHCFKNMERRLKHQSSLRKSYVEFMEEYAELGHMEPVKEICQSQSSYYMPHHAVLKEDSTTTKLRVVFNASAKSTNSLSLNDILMVGPTVQEDLFSIVLRFRMHRYALTADIEKMYRGIKVHPEDQDMQRIIWRSSYEEPIKIYKLNTVTYGTAAAPFLATRCLVQLAHDEQEVYPRAAEILKRDFYVDDLLTGADTIQNAIELQKELVRLLYSGGFTLRKWCANHPKIIEAIPKEFQETRLPWSLDSKDEPIKTLGLLWHPSSDQIQFVASKHSQKATTWTKRNILANIAAIYDPLGLLGPVIVRCKIILQRLWELRVNWDETLSDELQEKWQQIHNTLSSLNDIRIPRYVLGNSNSTRTELHGFSDASEQAYGACIYLRCVYIEGNAIVSLLTAKSRVAPLRKISLPRLELCGALLLARLMKKVRTAVKDRAEREFYWTDSNIVLAWIAGPPNSWKTYVGNRVSEIQELSDTKDWRHVPTQDNPADIISRGVDPQHLKLTRLWWAGPSWLKEPQNSWPKSQENKEKEVPERKHANISLLSVHMPWEQLLNHFSLWSRLLRTLAYVLRFISNLKCRDTRQRLTGSLTTAELHKSMNVIVQNVQLSTYYKEIQTLKQGRSVPVDSKLKSLHPFLDANYVLRVGGRLENSSASYDQRHPVIMPPEHHVTKLLILYEHQRLLHAGPQLLLASLRQRFWIPNGRSVIRKTIHKCLRCFRLKATTTEQLMGQLPPARVEPSKPFLNCGIDYGGPLYIKQGTVRSKVNVKCYIALFVCLAIKAIHLELVSSLTTEAFMAALRRFLARRGRCSNIYSDNATCFVGAKNELKELHVLFKSRSHQSKVLAFASQEGIEWHFVPPHAPHFGGLWEAGIKSVKYHLRRVVGNTVLTFEEMYTLLTQIEACLNSRPITPLPNSTDEFSFLTPGHFLVGEPLVSMPERDLLPGPVSRLSRWQLIQRCRQQVWKRWSSDYLSQLQQRSKWSRRQPNLQVGTLVIVKEDNLPPLVWQTGVIEAVHPGADGQVRVVSVRTSKGVYKRPITKLCVFPQE